SAELLTWASRELGELDATYLVTPAFRDYRRSLNAFDATVVDCPLRLDAIAPAIDSTPDSPSDLTAAPTATPSAQDWMDGLIPEPLSSRCGLLFNNPHNPTGLLCGRDRLKTLLDRFALVVVDEAFMDFLDQDAQQSVVDWVERYPNLVVLRSLTKFYSLPGLRLGYAIAHPDRLQRWRGWRDPWSVNALAAAAGIAVLADDDFQRQTLEWLPGVRSRLCDGLSRIPGLQPQPGAANFLLVRSEQSVVEIQARLLKHHRILIRDCLSFPELGDRYFRVAVRTDADNQALLAGLADTLTP
ncbi:MAG TPA: aminotransferase class I/II-fold pyridoxal phosphate-dependent enzyme, partial [Chroococcidiopsis sp.]